MYQLESYGTGQKPVRGFCKHCNETSVCTEGGEFIDWATVGIQRNTISVLLSVEQVL
jgi:hypothetical protein